MDNSNNKKIINNIIDKNLSENDGIIDSLLKDKIKVKLNEASNDISSSIILSEQQRHQYDLRHQYISKMMYKIRKLLTAHKQHVKSLTTAHQDLQDMHDKGVG